MKALKRMFLLLLLAPFATEAQTVKVQESQNNIEGQEARGYQVVLPTPEVDVKTSLTRYLKTMGKTRSSGEYINTTEPVIGGRKYAATLYAVTKQEGNTVTAWIGTLKNAEDDSGLQRDLKKITYDFGVTFHRERIQLQIDESVRAMDAVEKQKGRLINQNKDLNNKMESNHREKIRLEESLVDNKVELEQLKKNLQNNIKAQDSLAAALEQIRKVVEMHKERQRKVN